jgi:two-component system chemotaxis response regulator CheB
MQNVLFAGHKLKMPDDRKRTPSETIQVVVADDSPFICRLLSRYLESDPGIRVVAIAHNGKEAVDYVRNLRPDVLTLDLNMPVLNGIDALQMIMSDFPTAVVLISGITRSAADMTHKGLEMGAVDFIFKFTPESSIPPELLRREIIAKVRSASKVKVIRSIPPLRMRKSDRTGEAVKNTDKSPGASLWNFSRLVVIGASTGGPLALKELLSALNKGFTSTVVIVQHMPEAFTGILARQFDRFLPFSVKEAGQGDPLIPGQVLIAPGNRHLLFSQDAKVLLSDEKPVNGHRPSIDVTMQSAAHLFGKNAVGVILSGMGYDGASGVLAIKKNGGEAYIQSPDTCVVTTMPESAGSLGKPDKWGAPARIGQWLMENPDKRKKIHRGKKVVS